MGVTFDFLKSMFHPYGGTTNFIDPQTRCYAATSSPASLWTVTTTTERKRCHYHAARPAKHWR